MQKGLTLLVLLPVMFAIGLWIEGRIFPFDFSDPLVGLAACANLGIGLPYFVAKGLGTGLGRAVAATFEYGNTFAIVRGARLGRLVVERCDGKPQGPVVLRDVLEVFKSAGRPAAGPEPEQLRPSAQLKLLP